MKNKKLIILAMLMVAVFIVTGCQVMKEAAHGLEIARGVKNTGDNSGFEELREESERIKREQAEREQRAEEYHKEVYGDDEPEEQAEPAEGGCPNCRNSGENNEDTTNVVTAPSNIDPERIPADINAVMEAWKQDYYKLEENNFKYALLVKDSDFSGRNTYCFTEQYEMPYNLYSYDSDTGKGILPPKSLPHGENKFKTNNECLEAYGKDYIDECIALARKYVKGNWSCDYSNPAMNKKYAELWCESTNSYAGLDTFAGSKTSMTQDRELQAEADFLTDPSLVYQDCEGNMRVRGTTMIVNFHAVNCDIHDGDVSYIDQEIVIVKDESKSKVRGAIDCSISYTANETQQKNFVEIMSMMPRFFIE